MTTNILPTEIVRLYRVWWSFVRRCNDPKCKQYRNYGARGIRVCERWMDFNKFCEDMGSPEDPGLHLDRIDNNGGYSKENCRWIIPKLNHRNKRNNRFYKTHVGEICQAELIERAGYTRRQFRRSIEKYGEAKFLEMFKNGTLPPKRPEVDFQDIIGLKVASLTVMSLDPDKSTGARYYCLCDCGRKTRVSRFKLKHSLATECRSCGKMEDKNPKRKAFAARWG